MIYNWYDQNELNSIAPFEPKNNNNNSSTKVIKRGWWIRFPFDNDSFFHPSIVTTSGSEQTLTIPRLKFTWPVYKKKDFRQHFTINPLLAVLFYHCFSFFLVLLIPSCSKLLAIKGSSIQTRMTQNSMKNSSWSSSK